MQNELSQLLEDIFLDIRCHMWFTYELATHCFSVIVSNVLDAKFPNRLIDSAELRILFAYSPKLNRLDFYNWGHLKTVIYSSPWKWMSKYPKGFCHSWKSLNVFDTVTTGVDSGSKCYIDHLLRRKTKLILLFLYF